MFRSHILLVAAGFVLATGCARTSIPYHDIVSYCSATRDVGSTDRFDACVDQAVSFEEAGDNSLMFAQMGIGVAAIVGTLAGFSMGN
jgi:hypothetical protein